MVKIKSGFKKRNFHHVCILYAPSHLTTTCIIHMSIEIKYCEGKKEKIASTKSNKKKTENNEIDILQCNTNLIKCLDGK